MKDFIIPSDRDFGTPYVRSTATVTLNIDGFDVTVPEGRVTVPVNVGEARSAFRSSAV